MLGRGLGLHNIIGRLLAGAGCCWLLFISVGKIAFLSAGDISHISATLVNKVLCSPRDRGLPGRVCLWSSSCLNLQQISSTICNLISCMQIVPIFIIKTPFCVPEVRAVCIKG